jgi:hypothetical protein
MIMVRKHRLALVLALPLAVLVAGGCGFNENSGDPRANIRPQVFITNFPPASKSLIAKVDTTMVGGQISSIDTTYSFDDVVDTITYLANPRIYWYGTDEDGRVDAFEYAVVPTDSLRDHATQYAGLPTVRQYPSLQVDPLRFTDPNNSVHRDSLDWVQLLPPNVVQSSEVLLYADIDTTVAIDQFLFVRAIDNLGLRSDVKFARYSRQNHPPNTYIQLDTIEVIQPNFSSPRIERPRKYFSLPQATATYPGITIGWSGSDSTDFPDEQPPFEFNWVLYGPYPDRDSALPDSTKLRATNDNPATPRVEWTDQDRHTFFNLRSGWYAFEVRARDDAFVADPNPAVARFEVVEPSFHKPYLLLDATNWRSGQLINAGAVNFREPRDDSLLPDTIMAMYDALFSGHGYNFNPEQDTWHRQTDLCEDCYIAMPDRDITGQYKAIIVYDEDMQIPLDKDNQIREYENVLGEYLNVGGRVVLIGRNLFANSVTGWSSTSPPTEATFTPADFGWFYFGVTHMYFPGSLISAQVLKLDIADFVRTIALDPRFPVVRTDTSRTVYLSQLPLLELAHTDRTGDGNANWLYIPDVNWIGIDRRRNAEGFYQFDSYLPNTSPSQGRLVGARYEYFDAILGRPTFRTAIVTVPLFPLVQDDGNVRLLVRQLLDYILE